MCIVIYDVLFLHFLYNHPSFLYNFLLFFFILKMKFCQLMVVFVSLPCGCSDVADSGCLVVWYRCYSLLSKYVMFLSNLGCS